LNGLFGFHLTNLSIQHGRRPPCSCTPKPNSCICFQWKSYCQFCNKIQQTSDDSSTDQADNDHQSKSEWIVACKCVPPFKYAHLNCLNKFIDLKQNGNFWVKVSCPKCDFKYTLLYPRTGKLIFYLHTKNWNIFSQCLLFKSLSFKVFF
jgi:hypothetical protein